MSRPRAKRILGMTMPQWLVVGGMFLLIVCIVVGGFWWLNSMVAAAYEPPVLPTVEVTIPSPPTLVPTATSTFTPTATPILYESLIPADWKRYTPKTAPGLQIWFPASFLPQNEKDLQLTTPIYDASGVTSIVALKDTTPSPYLLITSFEAASRTVTASNLDDLFLDEFGELIAAGRVLEQDDFEFVVQDYPARRTILDITVNGMNAGWVIYLVQVGRDVYYLGFATAFNELYTRLPVFDQIIQTFRIVTIIPSPEPSHTPAPPTNTPKP